MKVPFLLQRAGRGLFFFYGRLIHQRFMLVYDQSLMTRDESLMTRDESLITRDESLMTRDESLMTRDESLMTREENLMTCDESLMTRDESLMTRDQILMTSEQSLITSERPNVLHTPRIPAEEHSRRKHPLFALSIAPARVYIFGLWLPFCLLLRTNQSKVCSIHVGFCL